MNIIGYILLSNLVYRVSYHKESLVTNKEIIYDRTRKKRNDHGRSINTH